ncbi:MAG TPA: ATP-dependent Clp protease ATP-binding subunit, partial [Myxococcota bacterium]|nr:ATP-dependent Clp protease ATP-binding subunit [Myxococcota bacterium]
MHLKKFSPSAQKVLMQCRSLAQKNHNLLVEPEHLALALLMTTELTELLGKKTTEHKELKTALLKLVSNFPVGVSVDPHFSSRLIQALGAADALSISKGHENIFVSDLFLSLLENRDKYGALGGVFAKYFLGTTEEANQIKDQSKDEKSQLFPLNDNINYLIKTEQLDPVFGRDAEVDRVIQILARKTRNNPILIGEPGVGRTSIVYALAKRIVEQKIPTYLVTKEIVALDVAALISGTTLRGQFEERVRKLINDLLEHQGQYILFVRDLSTLMGAGGDGASDAANLLKPSLARGVIQLIGLVTPDAYKKRIETDPSFERYFQPIWINQPEFSQCLEILLGLRDRYEQFHGVFIDDDAISAAIELGSRNITGGVLPELALNVLDEACSRHRVSIDAQPKVLTDLQDRVIKLEMDLVRLPLGEKKGKKEAQLKKARSMLKQQTEKYEKERSIIETMRAIKGEIVELSSVVSKEKSKGDIKKAADFTNKNIADLRLQFLQSQKELLRIKKSERFIDPWVKRDDIAQVISQETGIPMQRMLQSEREKLAEMEEWLSASVIDQSQAITAVANAIRRARAGLKDPKKPIGSFLFLGPTGVGKTELARSL